MTTPRIEETASKLTREILLENNIVVEDMLTKALTEAHQAGIDEAIADYQTNYEQKHIAEAVKLARDEAVEKVKQLRLLIQREKSFQELHSKGNTGEGMIAAYNIALEALDDTIKALQDK